MPKWHYDAETEEFKGDSLYFIREKDGPIKIGRGNPEARLQTLQIGNPRRLILMGQLPNDGFCEAFWHAAFSDFRLRGEWFRPDKSLLSAIGWALKGESWADEAPVPKGFDEEWWRDLMYDAHGAYMDWVFGGMNEREAAARAISQVDWEVLEVMREQGVDVLELG